MTFPPDDRPLPGPPATDRRARRTWLIVLACLGSFLAARVGTFLGGGLARDAAVGGPDAATGVAAIVALFALHLLLVHPRFVARPAGPPLVAMAVLTVAPYAWLGRAWGPMAGLLGASVGLRLRGWRAGGAFAAVVVADAAVGAVLFADQALFFTSGRLLVNASFGLLVYGLVRSARLVSAADADRRRLATLEVERARLRTATGLRDALGRDLSAIVDGLRSIDRPGEQVRDVLADVAARARRALAAARSVAALHRSEGPPRTPALPGTAVTSHHAATAAWWTMLLLVAVYAAMALANVAGGAGIAPADGRTWVAAAALSAVGGCLHQYHTAPRGDGRPPRGWRWTLAAQTVAVAVGALVGGVALVPLAALWVGAVAVRLPPPAAVVAAGVVSAGFVVGTRAEVAHPATHVYQVATVVTTAVAFHALARLPAVAAELTATRRQAAQLAVLRDRLRVARDVHDLLGSRLSAIALQAEVVGRRARHLPGTLRADLHELADLAGRALADTATIARRSPRLSLAGEITAAEALVGSLGATADVSLDPAEVPPGAEPALAAVVREAVANAVTHARPRRVAISGGRRGDRYAIEIRNDGVGSPGEGPVGTGAGLPNMAQRLGALGGTCVAGAEGDGYVVVAEVPTVAAAGRGTAVARAPQHAEGVPG